MSTDPIASIQEKLGERRHGLKLPNAVVKDLPSILSETLNVKSGQEVMELGPAVFLASLEDSGIYKQVPVSIMILAERWYGDGQDDTMRSLSMGSDEAEAVFRTAVEMKLQADQGSRMPWWDLNNLSSDEGSDFEEVEDTVDQHEARAPEQ